VVVGNQRTKNLGPLLQDINPRDDGTETGHVGQAEDSRSGFVEISPMLMGQIPLRKIMFVYLR
jgi:hypothetical protein